MVKGVAIHLPITFEDTHQYVHNTLPNASTLNFIINGLPTKTNNIWRGLVDLNKVYKALDWLMLRNVLYKDVTIDRVLLNNPSQLMFNDTDPIIISNDSDDGNYLMNILLRGFKGCKLIFIKIS